MTKLIGVAVAISLPLPTAAQMKAGLPVNPRQVSLPFQSVGPGISAPAVLLSPAALSAPFLTSVPSIMTSPAVAVAAAPIPTMKNDPHPPAAKPALDALTAGLSKAPAASAETLNLHFDAAAGHA